MRKVMLFTKVLNHLAGQGHKRSELPPGSSQTEMNWRRMQILPPQHFAGDAPAWFGAFLSSGDRSSCSHQELHLFLQDTPSCSCPCVPAGHTFLLLSLTCSSSPALISGATGLQDVQGRALAPQ